MQNGCCVPLNVNETDIVNMLIHKHVEYPTPLPPFPILGALVQSV